MSDLTRTSRPGDILDSWLAKYGESSRRGKGGASRVYGLVAEGDSDLAWLLLAIDKDGEKAIRDGVGDLLRKMIDREGEIELVALVTVNNGTAQLAPAAIKNGEVTRGDLAEFTDEQLATMIDQTREMGGGEYITVERVRAGEVPCTAVNLIAYTGLASAVTIFYPDESVFERGEQYSEEEVPVPMNEIDRVLMASMTFVKIVEECQERGYPVNAVGMIQYAQEHAQETGETWLLGQVLRLVGQGLVEGVIELDPTDSDED